MQGRAVLLVAIVAVSACGVGGSGATPRATPEPTPDAARTPQETGLPAVEDPEGAGINQLIAYGEQHADSFGGLYIDPPGGATVTMLFTRDLDAHGEAVAAILPGTRVREVRYTERQLRALQDAFDWDALQAEGVQPMSSGVDVIANQVRVEMKSDDPTLELRLEAVHGGMLDAIVYPIPGPWSNATEGDGWRLLAAGRGSGQEAYIVRAATTEAGWDELWDTLDLGGDQPIADMDAEVVVSFAHGLGSSCPEIRLDGVDIGRVVYSRTSDPLSPRGCHDDLVAAGIFVVAIDRGALPEDGFTLRLKRDAPGIAEDVEVELP
jgi:hypothetical protein